MLRRVFGYKVSVMSRVISWFAMKHLRLLSSPVLQGIERRPVLQNLLRQVVVVEMHIPLERFLQADSPVKVMGGQHFADPCVETLHHAVGLGVAGRRQSVLDAQRLAQLVEFVAPRGLLDSRIKCNSFAEDLKLLSHGFFGRGEPQCFAGSLLQ